MPNWCDNSVRIEGPVDKIYDMAKAMEENRLLEHMVPLSNGWDYHEAVDEWGTKWDISEASVTHNVEDGVIEGFFMSAWSPPTNAFETYSLNNPEVSIEHRYYEGGNDYCGRNGDERSGLPKYDDPLWDQDDVLKECDMEFGIRESMEQWDDEDE